MDRDERRTTETDGKSPSFLSFKCISLPSFPDQTISTAAARTHLHSITINSPLAFVSWKTTERRVKATTTGCSQAPLWCWCAAAVETPQMLQDKRFLQEIHRTESDYRFEKCPKKASVSLWNINCFTLTVFIFATFIHLNVKMTLKGLYLALLKPLE